MVAGPAARDAIARAKRLTGLRVGLHLVLVEGRSVLPAADLPDLVDASGRFRPGMAWAAAKMSVLPAARRQLWAEVAAQFAAFRATGLALDHVNAHKHFHLHPTILDAILAIGRDFGLRAIRIPAEPARVIAAIEPSSRRALIEPLRLGAAMMRRKAGRAGVAFPDQVFGLAWSGAMSAARIAALLERLPAGVSEIYTHPATGDAFAGCAPGYRYREEFGALTDPRVIAALRAGDLRTGGYGDCLGV